MGAGLDGSLVRTLTFEEPTGSNVDHAEEIRSLVYELTTETGAEHVDIVAHSMGGLATRWYLNAHPDAPIRRVAFLGTPHRGTLSAHLAWGEGRDEMLPDSPFLQELNALPAVPEHVEAITVRTPIDTHVLPGGKRRSRRLRGPRRVLPEPCGPPRRRGRLRHRARLPGARRRRGRSSPGPLKEPPWRGVFFDLDGTLADTVELILRSFRHTMEVHLGEVPPDERWLSTMGTPLVAQLRDFARDDTQAADMLETYSAFQHRVHDEMVRPFPGAVEAVASLAGRGARIAVVTSKRRPWARRTMEVCGLWDGVELLVSADDVVRGKPDPEPVLQALGALGLGDRPGQVLFVGDSPFDIRAGRAAGTSTAAVAWGPFARDALEAEGPDYVLESLSDLVELAAQA